MHTFFDQRQKSEELLWEIRINKKIVQGKYNQKSTFKIKRKSGKGSEPIAKISHNMMVLSAVWPKALLKSMTQRHKNMSPALWWLHHVVWPDHIPLPTHSAELSALLETACLPWARLEEFSSAFHGPAHWPQHEKKVVLLSKELQWGKTAWDGRGTCDGPLHRHSYTALKKHRFGSRSEIETPQTPKKFIFMDCDRKSFALWKQIFPLYRLRKEHIFSKCLRYVFKKEKSISVIISKSWQWYFKWLYISV